MTRFESEGVRRQQESLSAFEAKARFQHSCKLCAERGLGGDCSKCPVNAAHGFAIETFSILEQVKADMRRKKALAR